MDKYNINFIVIDDRTFNIADTLMFNKGSGLNGAFVSTKLAPMLMGLEIIHLDAQYAGYRFIISKIRNIKAGLNESITIVFMLPKNQKQLDNPTADMKGTPVWVDLKLALQTNEIIK